MSLLDLKTDLKSLKYGQDTPGGGNSREPYIKVDINKVDSGFNNFRLTKFDDGLVRGGVVGALNASVVDTLRIGKFFVDFPKGPLFLIKQVGLQLSNPRLESKQLPTDRPTTGGGFFNNVGNFISNTANRIENAVGPTRIYNLGINTLAQVPLNALGGHVVRHGFLPTSDPSKYYEAVVTQNNDNGTNRLERLRTELGLVNQRPRALQKRETPIRLEEFGLNNPLLTRFGPDPTQPETDPNLAPSLSDLVYQRIPPPTNQSFAITVGGVIPSLSYTGGPNSVYGLGRTNIRRFSNTEDRDLIEKAFSKSTQFSGKAIGENGEPTDINYPGTLGVSRVYFKTAEDIEKNTGVSLDNPTQKPSWGDQIANNSDTGSYTRNGDLPSIDASNDLVSNGPSSYPLIDSSSIAPLDILNTVYDYGSPALKTYSVIQQKIQKDSNISQTNFNTKQIFIDKASPTYKYNTGAKIEFNRTNDRVLKDDEIKVIFTPINPFTFGQVPIQFLSYLTSYGENYDSGWTDITYTGRAEKFYVFNSFKRTINFGLNVPCYNRQELDYNHKKLFALGQRGLAYALAGQYNENNLLGGVIIKLTVGNYIVDSPGIINNMKFDIVEGSSWDLDAQYAYYLKVDFGFTVIGNQLPIYEPPQTTPTQLTVPTIPPTLPVTQSSPPAAVSVFSPVGLIPPATSDYLGDGAGFQRNNPQIFGPIIRR